jgi:acetylornithine deacetylase/succinyl-diaminopimelate desuccinylase-like protein
MGLNIDMFVDDSLRKKVEELMPDLQARLTESVKLRSVNMPPNNPEPVQKMCQTVVDLFKDAGITDAKALPLTGNSKDASIVYASHPVMEDERTDVPTVLLYAHYDVQPPGEGWTVITDPFDPKVVNGRLYGRGAADDKSGIIMHLGAAQAFDGKPPVNFKVTVQVGVRLVMA